MTRLIIWRHGQTEWNTAKRFQGQTDTHLDAVGEAQATAAAAVLAAESPDAIVSSDLSRTAATAAALAAATGLVVHPEPRLRERHFGAWQGLTRAEVEAAFPDEFQRWLRAEQVTGCDIEELDDLGKRVAAGLTEALDRAPGGTVVAVTHGGAARYGIGNLFGWSHDEVARFQVLRNCHWSELAHDDRHGWTLRSYNVGIPRPR